MKYTILAVKQADDTIFTEIEYDFNGEKIQVSVPHFRPQTKEDVDLGIQNRFSSEDSKLLASKVCSQILPQIITGKVVEI